MKTSALRKTAGLLALASVAVWLAIFPLYMQGDPAVSFYDGTAMAQDLRRIRNIVLTRIALGLVLYVTLMVFAAVFRELVRRPGL